MKNYLYSGDIVPVTAAAALSSGDGVLVGKIFGVAQVDAASGEEVNIVTRGVFTLPKASTDTPTQGAQLYWDGSELTTTATGNTLVARAVVAAASGDETVDARLNG